jgi:glucose/arabinose dehydrogenase
MLKKLFLFFLFGAFSHNSWTEIVHKVVTEKVNIQVQQITKGHGVIWGMAFLSPGEILFTERSGGLGIVLLESGQVHKLQNTPAVLVKGQGGLLDVAVLPGYKGGDWVYFTYVKDKKGEGVTTLARAKINEGEIDKWQDLFVSDSGTGKSKHFGSRIAFDGKGHLFFTIGDRGVRPSAQDLMNHNGSVLRLNLDGTVPGDNPFVGNPKALPAIWSYGHRNPQGIVFDTNNHRLWVIEHGPRGGDEINLVLPGRNYGWPEISYGKEYWGPVNVADDTHKEGMEQPHRVYTPSIAPGSLLLYQGNAFPDWQGNLLTGALKLAHINRVVVSADGKLLSEERLLEDFGERIRSLIEGPNGFVYFSTDSGKIFRISPLVD